MTLPEALQLVLDAAHQTQRLNAGCRHTEGVADLQAEALAEVEKYIAGIPIPPFQSNNI